METETSGSEETAASDALADTFPSLILRRKNVIGMKLLIVRFDPRGEGLTATRAQTTGVDVGHIRFR